MKIYVKAARTVEQLTEQEGKDLGKAVLKELIELDPTSKYSEGKGGKYCPWIIRHYKSGDLTKEKFASLKDSLDLFAQEYRKFAKNDLNQYKTVDEFLDASREFGNRELSAKELEKMHGKQAHSAGDSDKKFLCEDGDWELWTPLTYAGSIALARSGGGKQAEWCTAWTRSDSYYRSYTSRGPLYIFLNKNNTGEKYQSHFGSDGSHSWFYDIDDREQGKDAFFAFLDKHPVFKEFFRVKDEGGLRTMGESIISYDPNAKVITIPESITKLPNFKVPDSCETFELPATMTAIPANAFSNTHIKTVIAPGVTRIGANAFNHSDIETIDLSHVTLVGSSAFRFCSNLRSVNLNTEDELHIGAYAFSESGLTAVTILPNMVLNMCAFDDCQNLTVTWKGSDDFTEQDDDGCTFNGIKLLVINEKRNPNVYKLNEGKVDIDLV